MQSEAEVCPSYCFSSSPAIEGYYPKWLDTLAEDVTLEGSMLDGVVQGPTDVRSVVATIRSLYDRQAHRFAGPSGNGGFLEDYVAEVRGESIGCVVLVTYNAAGETQRVVASYRPRTAVMNFARILAGKFAGAPIARHFADGGQIDSISGGRFGVIKDPRDLTVGESVPEGMTIVQSQFDPKTTMDRMAAAVTADGIDVFARIDLAVDAPKVNLTLRPTEVLIFGHPKFGAALVQAKQTVGIDLPMKALVWQDAAGKSWLSYNNPSWVAARHGVGADREKTIQAMAVGLAAQAKEATS